LIEDLDAALTFCIVEESKSSLESVTNYDEIKAEIQSSLELMRDNPKRTDKPLIYHLDVAAMYPNIMLSNRLQPDSIVDESTCAVCDYNRPGKTCDRRLNWAWRGEFFPAHRDEYNMIKNALNQEAFPPKRPGGPQRRFQELTEAEQTALLHKRLGDYSRKVYKKTKDTKVENREAIVCQRENPFYVDTVRTFRDRRYEYKGLHKTWKKSFEAFVSEGRSITEIDEAKKMIVIYDSLQLAHKCILNSFYGYVMRKGARWHSMEMAGITCLTGATIIQMARALVEQIGRPLELDTDGIWCMLPGVFPENFKFKLDNGKSIAFSYPCTMLNHLVHARFTNHQYHDLDPKTGEYIVHSENSIFFELDGPYRAMILPSSKEEDKLLKKRYAVFNDDGSLAELKGFEVKRRGELQLIKIFQSQIFERFLLGSTTEECYTAVAQVANQWLDVLFSKAENLADEELVELIAENRSMSKTLAEYGSQKSTSISTAKRLAEFLGDQMVKDKGLACKFIISALPMGAPVTERAVPIAIFSAEDSVKRMYLRKWLKNSSLTNFELRSILDWEYYIERLGSVIQKLITIPAAMQKVPNPVPRIQHPDWLHRRVAGAVDKFKQNKVTDFFNYVSLEQNHGAESLDIEDSVTPNTQSNRRRITANDWKPRPKDTIPVEPVEESLPPLPNPSVNYSAWVKAMKPRWRLRQAARSGSSSGLVPAMFREARLRTRHHRWDVIQIRPSKIAGRFTLWLSIESELVAVALRIPREFYIHMRTPRENLFRNDIYSCEKVIRSLPRGRQCANLYKVSVREDTYQEIQEHFVDLTNDPNVDGVFEQQVCLPLVSASISLIRIRSH
jgi:DNA polymerase epsilon subunit 1